MVAILLCLLTKNNENTIEKTIKSCSHIVDEVVVCDLQSEDQTTSICEKLGATVYIQMNSEKCGDEKFALDICNEAIRDKYKDDIYVLFLTPEMTVSVGENFSKSSLTSPKYALAVTRGETTTYETRLLKLGQELELIDESSPKLSGITVENSGNVNKEIIRRRLSYLQTTSRHFDLGEVYREIGNLDSSIHSYRKALECEKSERLWYTIMQLARLYRDKRDFPEMVSQYLSAYNLMPHRAESLCELSNYYRTSDKHNLAVMMALRARELSYPDSAYIGVHRGSYSYFPDVELSISSYYTPDKEVGYLASNRLMLENIPQWVRNMTLSNIIYYLPKVSKDLREISVTLPEKYSPLNPSLFTHEGKLYGCIRSVNYTQVRGDYRVKDSDGMVRTKNYFVEFDENFNITSQKEIVDKAERQMWTHNSIGVEDIRLFRYQDSWWFTCTAVQDTPQWNQRRIGLGKLQLNSEENTYDIVKFTVLQGEFLTSIEKNWLPFVQDDTLYFIYNTHPFTIITTDIDTGMCSVVKKTYHRTYDLQNLRGSAPPIPYEDGYLYVTHEVAWVNWRTYYHRVVKFNKNFEITAVSRPFIFDHLGVEFCISIINRSDTFYLGVGLEDTRAVLSGLDREEIEKLFS